MEHVMHDVTTCISVYVTLNVCVDVAESETGGETVNVWRMPGCV
jgi:hypothetical protein